MSDSEAYSDSPAPVAKPARKRKSDASTAAPKKKARASASGTSTAAAQALVTAVLANVSKYADPSDPQALGNTVVTLAEYARELEGALANGGTAPKTQEQLEAAAEKIRKAAASGIKSQMKWRPSCKDGGARWSYDGICADPAVFGALMGLGGPPTFKMKKFKTDEFQSRIGRIKASARYNDMYIISEDVNVRWSETGEFKFSGLYGVPTRSVL